MSGLVTRPARLLTVLDAVAWWPIWVGALMLGRFVDGGFGPQVFRIFEETTGALFFFGVGAIVVLLWARTQRAELPTRVHRTARAWLLQCGFAVLAIALGVRWDAYQLPVMAVGCAAALAAGAWQLALARRARRWLSGVLVVQGDEVWIDAGATRFVLHSVPRGCADGAVLTLPSVRVDEAAAGPYRSGLPRGHAPEVWRVDGELLARRLAARGGAMIGWAFLSALWMAL